MKIRNRFTIQMGVLRCLAVAGALAIIGASPSVATPPVTFASYQETNSDLNEWTITTTTCTVSSTCTNGLTTTTTASGSVQFEFSGVPGAPVGELTAELSLSATSCAMGNCGGVVSPACSNGDSYGQSGYAGMFFHYRHQLTDGKAGPAVRDIRGHRHQPEPSSVQVSGPPAEVFNASATQTNLLQFVLSSSYLNFSGVTEDASL